MNMTGNPYHEVNRDHQAALRGIRPEIANRPAPAQAFSQGVHTGREAAVSREVTNFNQPRKE
jgi:hypothetical protein